MTTALRNQYLRSHTFTVSEQGLVVPRRVHRNRDHDRADTFDQILNTLRISQAATNECIWLKVDELSDHPTGLNELRIGQVPIATPRDLLRRGVETAAGTPAYELRPSSALHRRIPAAASALADAGVDIGITAEATLDTDGLNAWMACANLKAPRWILAGTGPVELDPTTDGVSAPPTNQPFKDGSAVPVNRAVIINGRSGKIIAVADKRRGYHIDSSRLTTIYGLPGSPRGRAEGIRSGTRFVILESNAGRFCVLVCEDLDRLLEFGSTLREVGVSHVLNPVVAPELIEYRWQHKDGQHLDNDIGARLVTANSLAVQRFRKDPAGAPTKDGAPTLLVVDGLKAQLVPNSAASSQTVREDALTVRTASVSTAPMP